MTDDKKRDHNEHGHAIAAVFDSREEAHQALGALHKAHFRKVWFGVTSVATTSQGAEAVTVENAGGFFSLKSQGLVDALVEHGVDGDGARQIVSTVEPGQALLTVDPEKQDPSQALDILRNFSGRIEGMGSAFSARAAEPSRVAMDKPSPTATPNDDSGVWEEETFFHHPPR